MTGLGPKSPRFSRGILEWAAGRLGTPDLVSDAEELFAERVERNGARGARAWYRKQARAALRRGLLTWARQESRRVSRQPLISWLDVKLAARMLTKHPMLTTVAALALGLGIPASLTPTHVWHAFMAPLPFEDAERIVGIRWWDTRLARPVAVSLQDFQSWRENLTSFEQLGATRRAPWNLQLADGRAFPVRGAEMSASTFDVLRVPPTLGRTLDEADDVPGSADVVVVGAGVWASHFQRSPDVIGTTVRVGGVPHTIVGVMPEGFSYPRDEVIWLPLRGESTRALQVVGRLVDGVSFEAARSEVEATSLAMRGVEYVADERVRPEVVTTAVQRAEVPANGDRDPLIYAVQILAICLLLIVCGNVGIMILARTSARSGEIAVRGALGASRRRIVGQLFLEGLVLALLATGVGLGVATWAIRRFEALAGPEFSMMDFGMNTRTVTLALCLSVLCAGAASVIPALKVTAGGLHRRLVEFAGRGSAIRFGASSTALIVAQIAFSVGLLSYGVVWTRTVLQDTSGEMGIALDRYLSAQVLMSDPVHGTDVAAYPDELLDRLSELHAELKRRLEAEPAVRAVAMASGGDLPGSRNAPRRVEVENLDAFGTTPGATAVAWSRVDVDFFRDLDRPVLQGRDFAPADLPQALRAYRSAVIVNTTFVEQVLAGRNPIGRRLRYTSGEEGEDWYEIVGVVGPLGLNPVNPQLDAGVYHPMAPGEVSGVGFVLDVGDDPTAFIPRLKEIAAEVDPAAMVQQTMPLSDLAAREWLGLRYLALVPVVLSLIAILLSATGLYAVMAFSVTQRTREIGIRGALGAPRASILAIIGRKAMLQLGLGMVSGCVLATPLLMSLSGDPLVKPQNPVLVVAAVVTGLALLGLVACSAPALRAARIPPTEALREG
ncbi:MAG: ABC transporter permease [Gemmatimonadota bacterium]